MVDNRLANPKLVIDLALFASIYRSSAHLGSDGSGLQEGDEAHVRYEQDSRAHGEEGSGTRTIVKRGSKMMYKEDDKWAVEPTKVGRGGTAQKVFSPQRKTEEVLKAPVDGYDGTLDASRRRPSLRERQNGAVSGVFKGRNALRDKKGFGGDRSRAGLTEERGSGEASIDAREGHQRTGRYSFVSVTVEKQQYRHMFATNQGISNLSPLMLNA